MIDLASPLTIKDKFIIFGGGFSGDYFAKSIRKVGCKALTSSRSKKLILIVLFLTVKKT